MRSTSSLLHHTRCVTHQQHSLLLLWDIVLALLRAAECDSHDARSQITNTRHDRLSARGCCACGAYPTRLNGQRTSATAAQVHANVCGYHAAVHRSSANLAQQCDSKDRAKCAPPCSAAAVQLLSTAVGLHRHCKCGVCHSQRPNT